MSTILHLSDLHLGPPEESQFLDTHKSLMAGEDRRAQKDILRETLSALDGEGTLAEVDAVVISGDLTNRCRPEGFDEFTNLIAPILEHVEKTKVVVVPGNHDVPWDLGPTNPARYDEFLRVTREAGLITPLIDGRDLSDVDNCEHLITGEDFVVVPINSSHFCWGMEPLDDAVVDEIFTVGSDELAEAVAQLRRHDVARVSNAQMRSLLDLLRAKEPRLIEDRDDDRVRIATLHHQLLPVSPAEELKSFEALSNLGAVRELLAQLRIHVVLHGHKHTAALFWDYVAEQGDLGNPPHRMLACAAPGDFKPGLPVMRLLRTGKRPLARDVVVEDVMAPRRAAAKPKRKSQRARLWRSTAVDMVSDAMTIHGNTVGEVYAQIRSLFEERRTDQALHDLVCEIAEPVDAGDVPADYPRTEGIEDVQVWMNDLVEWWQLHDPQLLKYVAFNHGERIYRHWGDQVERAVKTLQSGRAGTTRAVIMLLDPWTDGKSHGDFPSFVLIQLQLAMREGVRELDCTGYFRKQEMRYWWPINVAELALVQAGVLKGLVDGEDPIRQGRLRTVTAYAASEDKLPAVALAAIDRAVDQHPDHLWSMAYGLVDAKDGERSTVRERWEMYLSELEPANDEPSGTLPISYRGLSDIGNILKWLGVGEERVGKALRALADSYSALHEQKGSVRADTKTVGQTRRLLGELREALDEKLGTA